MLKFFIGSSTFSFNKTNLILFSLSIKNYIINHERCTMKNELQVWFDGAMLKKAEIIKHGKLGFLKKPHV